MESQELLLYVCYLLAFIISFCLQSIFATPWLVYIARHQYVCVSLIHQRFQERVGIGNWDCIILTIIGLTPQGMEEKKIKKLNRQTNQ